MTKYECAVVMAYTGIAMLQGEDLHYFYAYLSKISGRNIYTHEIPVVVSHFKNTVIREDFLSLCKNAKEADENE